ncbi:MAG TPA: hypothetical protein VGH28_10205 [Polyangiaceae bacterium]|jgi:hypothetical protein
MRNAPDVSALPAIASGSLAMLALAGVTLPSIDAGLLALALGIGVAAARARGAIAGSAAGAGAAIVALVGATHGHAATATIAGACIAIVPLGARFFPRGSFRLLILAAAALATRSLPDHGMSFAPWAGAVALYAVSVDRARSSERVDWRTALGLAVSVALLGAACAHAPTSLVFAAVLAATCVISAAPRDRLSGVMLAAAWPAFDAIALAACGHPVLALECLAVVPLARRLALLGADQAIF